MSYLFLTVFAAYVGVCALVVMTLIADRQHPDPDASLEDDARYEQRRIAKVQRRAENQIHHLTHEAFDQMLGQAEDARHGRGA